MNWTCHTPRFVARKCFESCGVRYAVQVSIDVVVGICVICSRWLELYTAYCAKKSVDLTTTLFDTENWERPRDWANGRLANCFETSDTEILGAGQFISIYFNTLMGLALRLCTGVCGCPRLCLYSGNQRCTARLSWYGDMDLHGLYGLCLCSPQCKDNLSDSLKLSQVLALVSNSQRKQ
jgi:hypothetical protein